MPPTAISDRIVRPSVCPSVENNYVFSVLKQFILFSPFLIYIYFFQNYGMRCPPPNSMGPVGPVGPVGPGVGPGGPGPGPGGPGPGGMPPMSM